LVPFTLDREPAGGAEPPGVSLPKTVAVLANIVVFGTMTRSDRVASTV
jgi:hypothetical protein